MAKKIPPVFIDLSCAKNDFLSKTTLQFKSRQISDLESGLAEEFSHFPSGKAKRASVGKFDRGQGR